MENAHGSENSEKIQTDSSATQSTDTSSKDMTSATTEHKHEHHANGVTESIKDSTTSQIQKDDVEMEEQLTKEESKSESSKIESEEKSAKESEDQSSNDQISPRDGRPKRDRKPSSLLGEDFETGDSLVGGRKAKSPTPPQSPIPLSQRRKKHTTTEGTESKTNEGGVDGGDATDAANELVKLASTATSEDGDEEESKEKEKPKEGVAKDEDDASVFYKEEETEPGSPMAIEPITGANLPEESEEKKRKRIESPAAEEEQSGDNDSRNHPKRIRFKYRDTDESAPTGPSTPTGTPTKDPLQRMEKLEKDARDEKQKRKQVEEENAQLRAEIRSLKKQIADLSKTPVAPVTPVSFSKIEGNEAFITDERFKKCHKILLSLMKHKFGHVFNESVDPVRLNIPDYFEVIRNPMDFGTIKLRIEGGKFYKAVEEFIGDVMLVFSNAKLYNGSGSDIWNMADTLEKIFEKKMAPIFSGDVRRVHIPTTPTIPMTVAPTYYAPPPPPETTQEMNKMMKQLADMQAAMINMQSNFEAMKKEKSTPPPPATYYRERERERIRDLSPPPELPRDRVPRKRDSVQKAERERPPKLEKPSPRVVKEPPPPPPPVDEDALLSTLNFADKRLSKCYKILSQLKKHKYSYPFLIPVDPVRDGAANYFEIIKHPMDFGTITKNLETLKYENIEDFSKDMYFVFNNAKTYNPVGSDIYVMADTLQKVFERKMAAEKMDVKGGSSPAREGESMEVAPATPTNTATPPPAKKSEDVKHMTSALKEMKDSMQQAKEIIGELKTGAPTKQKLATPKAETAEKTEKELKPMSFEEKYALSQKLSELSPDQLGNVVQIIKEHQPNLVQEPTGEIEINLDILDTAALRHLEKFVNECENRDKKKASKKQNRTGSGSDSESDTSSESDG